MKLFKVKIHLRDAQIAHGILEETYRMEYHSGFSTSEELYFFDEDEADGFVDDFRKLGFIYVEYARPVWFGKVF